MGLLYLGFYGYQLLEKLEVYRYQLPVKQHLGGSLSGYLAVQTPTKMVNATKGLFISCDIPMAQFIINLNASLPASQKFIIHILDSTHMFVQSHVSEMIRSAIADFREQNSYEKPA
ncbi:unnamed protein product [Dovyalis caffra]|uniref:General transcription and DNA repair factor IIH subunit TFB5 n=1 Tax=Dovyalis caffra TaxID=77055 RepID=A0AAV1RQ97_9ROSI|nr:unnamed protein product [Dovyalis caffra]